MTYPAGQIILLEAICLRRAVQGEKVSCFQQSIPSLNYLPCTLVVPPTLWNGLPEEVRDRDGHELGESSLVWCSL